MTSVEFIQKVTRLKQAWRRGVLTDDEFRSKMAELRARYYRISEIRLSN